MKKVAIIRGSNLNKWEMQNYEPLMDTYDITAYTTTRPLYDISDIKIPIVRLETHPDHPDTYMPGLEDHLADKDIIFTADITWMYSSQAIVAREKYGARVICLQWENIPFAYDEIKVVRDIKRIVRDRADYFIAVTERAREALVLEGVQRGLIEVIPMGIDLSKFRPDQQARNKYRNELGIKEDEPVITFIGRMVWEKGVYDFINAAAMILKDKDTGEIPVKFLMVGSGPEVDNIKSRLIDIGLLDRVIFIGQSPYPDMPHIHNLTDIFVLPSISTRKWQEQFGMVLIESMACGKPVIASLSGSIPEVVSDCGILVQPNDAVSLSDAMRQLLLNQELRESLGQVALKRVRREFDSNMIAPRISNVFERVSANTFVNI